MKEKIGKLVRQLREDANLSQTALGSHLQMSQRKISYIENGQFEPSTEDIVAICRFFGVSADYLLGLSDKK
ncbi:MAG: helix-turn-helix transcriptional regulator [Clostridia bacterium]|nr:helix-turn-helix transcriptional regulator [Clostridia bacterium]